MMLPGIGDYRDPYEDYTGYLWDEPYPKDDDEDEEGDDDGQA